jgi:hypothetical protein
MTDDVHPTVRRPSSHASNQLKLQASKLHADSFVSSTQLIVPRHIYSGYFAVTRLQCSKQNSHICTFHCAPSCARSTRLFSNSIELVSVWCFVISGHRKTVVIRQARSQGVYWRFCRTPLPCKLLKLPAEFHEFKQIVSFSQPRFKRQPFGKSWLRACTFAVSF